MHELGITRNLVAIVSEAAQGRRVNKVCLEIGERSALMPDAVRLCFDVVGKGTVLEAATLEIIEVRTAQLMVTTKMDLAPHVQFDVDAAERHARSVNPLITCLRVSATSGEGLNRAYPVVSHDH